MRSGLLFFVLPILFFSSARGDQLFPYAVIGAGPAGIISVAKLIELGVPEKSIVWIDPEFGVGRLGKYYGKVPSNLKARRYTIFLTSCELFKTMHFPSCMNMFHYDQNQEPPLQLIVDPLQDITAYLKERVVPTQARVSTLTYADHAWHIMTDEQTIRAEKVILAMGSRPKRLNYDGFDEIPLDLALDEDYLKQVLTPQDRVIVVGSLHSALLVLKYASDIPVQQAINFYTKLPTYGPAGGLEGITAYWTKEVLDQHKATNVIRFLYDPQAIEQYKNKGYKIVYAIGYEPNVIRVNGSIPMSFDADTGKICDNLYGIGIAFAERYTKEDGMSIPLIGVNSFMKRAQEILPEFIAYG